MFSFGMLRFFSGFPAPPGTRAEGGYETTGAIRAGVPREDGAEWRAERREGR